MTDERGSLLVEAMIAIAVLAMVLAAGYAAVGQSALRAKAAEAGRTAMLIARSQLDAVGAETPLAVGETNGTEQGFRWSVRVDDEPSPPSATGELVRVTVTVRDNRAERARLTTLKLVPEGGA